jgi:histidyl-tRNA synthetase
VSLARYLGSDKIADTKRHHVAEAHRHDQQGSTRSRFRKFCRRGFDIAGQSDTMLPDAECLRIIVEILTAQRRGALEVER